MELHVLESLQNRLERSSTMSINLAGNIGKIKSMIYGVDNRGRFTAHQVNEEKSRIRTDLDNLINELTSIKNDIV